jgi:hypothetical protein
LTHSSVKLSWAKSLGAGTLRHSSSNCTVSCLWTITLYFLCSYGGANLTIYLIDWLWNMRRRDGFSKFTILLLNGKFCQVCKSCYL